MDVAPGKPGTCPHCKLSVRFEVVRLQSRSNELGEITLLNIVTPSNHLLQLVAAACPSCGRVILSAVCTRDAGKNFSAVDAQLWPDTAARPVPPEVEAADRNLAADFREAVTVLPKSKKASAALSRRCLQMILTTKGGATSKDLASQIDEVLPKLPSGLAENVDAIRQVGNFAAHPIKATNTGEIAEVEDGEAEWLLDVLEELFDHFYVAPAKAAAMRATLNQKLGALGKPALKAKAPPSP